MPFFPTAGSWLRRMGRTLATSAALAGIASAQTPGRLPALGLNADAVTVSGLSSGAYMAGQFEVAYSASISGAAILAGGPYGCSRGSVSTAVLKCSCPAEKSWALSFAGAFGFGCDVQSESVYEHFAAWALAVNHGLIDDPANMARHRLWMFSGGKDAVVDTALVVAAKDFYGTLSVPAAQVHLERRADAGHGFPSASATLPCGITGQPFLIDCGGFDAAGALLRWLYPDLPVTAGTAVPAALRPFAQTAAQSTGFTGLDTSGWVYVPAACEAAGAHCRLHVAFHGCEQGQSFHTGAGKTFGRQFVDGAGYNRWAEAGGIVVLYPQVRATTGGTPYSPYRYNPQGCWDFWGYSTDTEDTAPLRFSQRDAPQMKAVKAMIDALLRSPS